MKHCSNGALFKWRIVQMTHCTNDALLKWRIVQMSYDGHVHAVIILFLATSELLTLPQENVFL